MALFWLLGSCSNNIEPAQPLLNECTQDFECDSKDTCDVGLGICVRPTVDVDAQYPFALQIAPTSGTLVSNVTIAPQVLKGPLDLSLIPFIIPSAVKVTGKVVFDGIAREAELAFRTPQKNVLKPTTTVITLPAVPGTSDNLSYAARLEPNTTYEVAVFPLGAASWELPPQTFPLAVATSELSQDFTYGERLAFRGRLLGETGIPLVGHKLRLRSEETHDTVSSLGRTDMNGDFLVWTTQPVLEQLARQELQIELEPSHEAWSTTIAVDGERLRFDGGVTIPMVPALVPFEARIEASDRVAVDHADVTFRSSFPLPEAGQVNGRDWCRTRTSMDGGIHCSTVRTISVGSEGILRAQLLPGDYDIYIQPRSRDSSHPERVRTSTEKVRIETQPGGGAQQGSYFSLPQAKMFTGTVVSPRSRPMPFVGVTAQALGFKGTLGEVAAYNRTAETLSEGDGQFQLAVDVGYYDLTGRPPEGSGFAWTVWPNREVLATAPNAGELTLSPSSPVIARGRLTTRTGAPVTQARVDAYAMVVGVGGERPVRVAQAVSDDAGVFVLYLPPELGRDRNKETMASQGMDAGIELDGGVPPETVPLIRRD